MNVHILPVHHAQKFKKWIAPELVEKLKKDSGRNNCLASVCWRARGVSLT